MKNFQISDKQLIKNYRNGNEACFEMLLNRYKSKVFTTIYLIVQDKYIAEDIFQETFIKVVRTLKSEKYKEEGKYLPWVITIARNLAIDYFRRNQKMPKITGSNGEDIIKNLQVFEKNREEEMIQNQKEAKVRELIKLLPQEQQEVLVLRHYGELSFKEISDITQVSINTALGRMRYALHNLRKLIEEKELSLR
ncbi:MAG: sigma-70 family RNA polymerase sigma factor [Flavobacteriales bacterium]|nr:sigma-70 family RNA polymerase sigma factor [Flavobacteriales bacterium]